jgi:ATP-dependent DNA helicase RecG
MYSDRVEFISPGGLVNGIELDDIMSGYSVCRNPALAAALYRLQLIEAYGTGILKIFEAYRTSLAQPKIEVTPNVFKMILPNLNAAVSTHTDSGETLRESVLRFTREHGSITRKQLEQLLNLSQTAAGTVLRKMTANGELKKAGNSRNVRYFAGNS